MVCDTTDDCPDREDELSCRKYFEVVENDSLLLYLCVGANPNFVGICVFISFRNSWRSQNVMAVNGFWVIDHKKSSSASPLQKEWTDHA